MVMARTKYCTLPELSDASAGESISREDVSGKVRHSVGPLLSVIEFVQDSDRGGQLQPVNALRRCVHCPNFHWRAQHSVDTPSMIPQHAYPAVPRSSHGVSQSIIRCMVPACKRGLQVPSRSTLCSSKVVTRCWSALLTADTTGIRPGSRAVTFHAYGKSLLLCCNLARKQLNAAIAVVLQLTKDPCLQNCRSLQFERPSQKAD